MAFERTLVAACCARINKSLVFTEAFTPALAALALDMTLWALGTVAVNNIFLSVAFAILFNNSLL